MSCRKSQDDARVRGPLFYTQLAPLRQRYETPLDVTSFGNKHKPTTIDINIDPSGDTPVLKKVEVGRKRCFRPHQAHETESCPALSIIGLRHPLTPGSKISSNELKASGIPRRGALPLLCTQLAPSRVDHMRRR